MWLMLSVVICRWCGFLNETVHMWTWKIQTPHRWTLTACLKDGTVGWTWTMAYSTAQWILEHDGIYSMMIYSKLARMETPLIFHVIETMQSIAWRTFQGFGFYIVMDSNCDLFFSEQCRQMDFVPWWRSLHWGGF